MKMQRGRHFNTLTASPLVFPIESLLFLRCSSRFVHLGIVQISIVTQLERGRSLRKILGIEKHAVVDRPDHALDILLDVHSLVDYNPDDHN